MFKLTQRCCQNMCGKLTALIVHCARPTHHPHTPNNPGHACFAAAHNVAHAVLLPTMLLMLCRCPQCCSCCATAHNVAHAVPLPTMLLMLCRCPQCHPAYRAGNTPTTPWCRASRTVSTTSSRSCLWWRSWPTPPSRGDTGVLVQRIVAVVVAVVVGCKWVQICRVICS